MMATRFCLFVCVLLTYLALFEYVTAGAVERKLVQAFQINREDYKGLDDVFSKDLEGLDDASSEDLEGVDVSLGEDPNQESQVLDLENLKTEINQLKDELQSWWWDHHHYHYRHYHFHQHSQNKGTCKCEENSCQCCLKNYEFYFTVDDQEFKLSSCVNVTYLHGYKYDVEVTLDDKVLQSNKIIDIEEPPKLCYDVPDMKGVEVCVEFNDVSEKHACVELSGSIYRHHFQSSAYVHVACFTIPDSKTSNEMLLGNSEESEE